MARTPNEPQDPAPPEARPRGLRVIDATPVRFDLATEARLLSSLMADVTTWPAVEGTVRAEHFWGPSNAHIFAAVEGLHAKGRNPWPPQVIDELRQAGLLEVVGGAGAIEALATAYEPGGRYRSADDARLIAHYSRSRKFLAVAEDLRNAASRADHDAALSLLQRAGEDLAEEAELAASWKPVDVGAILESGLEPVLPSMLERTDGHCLLYPGRTHAFNAEPEACKTWIALWVCAEEIIARHHVLYVDFEADAESVLERLIACSVDAELVAEFFHYVRPDDPFDIAARARIVEACTKFSPTIAVLDGVAEVMAMNAWDENSNTDIAAFLNALPRLLEMQGAAVLMIDHLVKDKANQGRYARGGAHKLAGISGAAYMLEVVRPFGRGTVGRVKLTVTKDRPGWVRRIARGSVVADVELVSTDQGNTVVVELNPPAGEDQPLWDGPTHCMDAVLTFLVERSGQEYTQNRVETELREMDLSYRAKTVRDALAKLVASGQVAVRNGPNRSRLYRATTTQENTLHDF